MFYILSSRQTLTNLGQNITFLLNCTVSVPSTHNLTSPPKVIWEECVTTPDGRECTHPLCVLAVQCPLHTSPVTQPWIHYIHTMIPHLDTSVPNRNLYHNPDPTYHTNPTTTAG